MSKPNANAITWFEIPTTDFDRATRFYEQVLGAKLTPFPGDEPMNMFPYQSGEGVGGALVQRPQQTPGAQGSVVYLHVDGPVEAALERAKELGAPVLAPRTPVPGGFGFFGCITDSEGNCVGLHSEA